MLPLEVEGEDDATFIYGGHKVLDDKLGSWWGNRYKISLSIGIVLVILGLTLAHFYAFLGKGIPPNLVVNNLCSPCRVNETIPEYCELPKEYQFEKVIWFITDGYPMYMQKKWLENYSNHSLPYTVGMPGNKWSHTIYTTWFTGMTNVNILARKITGDTIFESAQRAGAQRCSLDPLRNSELLETNPQTSVTNYTFRWIGPTWCPVDLLGGAKFVSKNLNFPEIDVVNEDMDLHQHPYPAFDVKSLPAILEDVAAKGESLITHTGIIDKEAHYGRDSTKSEEFLYELFASSVLKDFIANHSDYLLILSSDHGRSLKGLFHGEGTTTATGNIGMFTFYNPIFEGQNMSQIDVVDVHPTLAKYLKNVDISFYSVGESRNTYGPNGTRYSMNALKQNLAQLTQLMKSDDQDVDEAAIQAAMEGDDIEAVRDQVRIIKSGLFHPLLRPFYLFTILFIFALLVGVLIYWTIFINNKNIFVTIALCFPIGVSTGYFFKPIIYAGAISSLLVASGFSGWRITGYLLLNEFFNLLGFLFKTFLSNFSVVPYIGILLSLLESLYHYRDTKSRVFVVFLHLLNFFFIVLPKAELLGFNVFALISYGLLPLLVIRVVVEGIIRVIGSRFPRSCFATLSSLSYLSDPLFHSPSLFTMCITCVSLLIFNSTPLIALVNFQARQILPCLFEEPPTPEKSTKKSFAFYPGLQACSVYVLQQALWVTWFVWALNPNLEVDINAGVPGIHNWNDHPIFAGAILGMQKLGVYPLFLFHVSAIIPNILPIFIYFIMILYYSFSIHICFKFFEFKFQIETLLIVSLCTFVQFLVTILLKFTTDTPTRERTPWASTFFDQITVLGGRFRNRYTLLSTKPGV